MLTRDPMHKLGDRFGKDHLIMEALKAIGFGVTEWWRRCDHKDGRAVGEGCCQPRKSVAKAGVLLSLISMGIF